MHRIPLHTLILVTGLLASLARATETEHLGLSVLPATISVDGDSADWDLRAGVFVCGNVETQRDKLAAWVHAAYDRDHLYILARWIDQTPLDNPGSIKGSYGFNGDCLLFRVVTAPGQKHERFSHWTCWRDNAGADVLQATYGKDFKGGSTEGKSRGGKQAFKVDADGRGYTQEIAIPWALLVPDGAGAPRSGDKLLFTVEPNFTLGGGRLATKDVFRAGAPVNRIFTHSDSNCWGTAMLEPKAPETPRPARIADAREFPVTMVEGTPRIDWTGLIQSDAPRGFKEITFDMPQDGYVSLNLIAPDGTVARQLLTSAFYTKGRQTVLWDGLTTPSARVPGEIVAPGEYAWRAIYHTGIGVRLEGRALDGEGSSWDAWGGDHGNPVAAASDGQSVYLGWASGEAGKPVMAVDSAGKPKWKNIRGGIAGARLVASDGTHVYVYNDVARYASVAIYKLDAKKGNYVEWAGRKSTDLLVKDLTDQDAPLTGLAAGKGRVYVSIQSLNRLLVLNAESGKLERTVELLTPGDVEVDGESLLVLSDRNKVARVDPRSGEASVLAELPLDAESRLSALAVDAEHIYVGVRGTNHQILVLDRTGKLLRTIGREGGRARLGAWQADGLRNISGLALDAKRQLWVAEDDGTPRRVSVWNAGTGALVREFFGPSPYGAGGGVVNPVDPSLLIAQGCEWRIDPTTGRATLLGTATRTGIGNGRFGFSADKRLFLATTNDALHGVNPVHLFERLGDAHYKLRTTIWREKSGELCVWSDANDDAERQDDEIARYTLSDYDGWITGWYMPMTPDLTFYGSNYVFAVTGYTACGAPLYDLSKAKKIAGPPDLKKRTNMYARRGHGSVDGTLMLYNGQYGAERSTFDCYDITTGALKWTYPNNYVGVHGSHKAPGPINGMIRGAFDIVGAAKLPEPIGNLFVIPTNKGEWHLLTGDGFYLARLFEGDPLSMQWPEKPVPGAILDNTPPGAGEEAFGGSITQSLDGSLYAQVGHTSYWKTRIVGLETVKPLANGTVTIGSDDLAKAEQFRAEMLQARTGLKRYTIQRGTPTFTGDLGKDFGTELLTFAKQPAARVRAGARWDDKNLYVGWEVRDDTPWVNGADAPEFVYARGDTVDLQFGTDPKLNANRDEAGAGDIRLAIAPHKGKPVVVAYRKTGKGRAAHFRSGVVDDYLMHVEVIETAQVSVNVDKVKRVYVVEASIPLSAIDLPARDGLKIRGDFGATHGNASGNDTALRTHWNNQNTGIVSDEVFELKMSPGNWGELEFKE